MPLTYELIEVRVEADKVGVITLNLPRIAIEARGSQEVFWALLEERLQTVNQFNAGILDLIHCLDRFP